MSSFLEKTAEYLNQKYGDLLGDICIVLPNRRARLFFHKYIAKEIKKTIWSPQIYSIEEFVEELSGLQIIDNLTLYLEFYSIHKTIKGDDVESFDEFIKWAQSLLADFNEVDLYLADPDKLYNYLTEAKALKVWNLEKTLLSDYEKDFLKFYNLFLKYYAALKNNLLNKNQAYSGLAYRNAAEKIDDLIKTFHWEKIIFAGFNALNTAEEKIIDKLLINDKAEILWDVDKYYLEKPEQEAGRFIRKYKAKWNLISLKWEDNYFLNTSKDITIIGVPQQIGQAKVMGQLLSSEIKMDNYENTAVVLADENLLIPVLNSIPDNVEQFNVTMGLSLKNIPLYSLFDSLFILHENAKRLSKIQESKENKFYHKDILKIFNHPYFIKLSGKNTVAENNVVNVFQSTNKIFYSKEELTSLFSNHERTFVNLIENIFDDWHKQLDKSIDCFLLLIKSLKELFIENNNSAQNEKFKNNLEIEYLFSFSKLLNQVSSLFKGYHHIQEIKTLRIIFNQLISNTTLPFFGEPLKGLQIMGMLETRTLDFENVILLSANEGILPSGKSYNSFIPYDIRKEFNLPTYRDRDSVYAYHFYRLLQRASNVYLVYNTQNDDFGGGERSRFISQIIHELPKYNPQIIIRKKVLNVPIVKSGDINKIEIPKNKDVIEKLKKRAVKGFSASVLNLYINCPLQFYLQAVAGIKELEEVEETVDAATMGSVVHEVLLKLFYPFIDRELTEEDLKKMLNEIELAANDAFKNNYPNGEIRFGKNLLIVKVVNKFIANFILKEIELVKSLKKKGISLIIKNLENKIETEIQLSIPEKFTIKLTGFIDRIDKIGEILRIVDYKTGKTDKKELIISEWSDLINDSTLSKSFQMMLYSFMFSKNFSQDIQNVEAGIISFRNLSQGFMKINIPENNFNKETFDGFEELLKQLFTNIFDQNNPFVQTENTDNCKYCAFTSLCNR